MYHHLSGDPDVTSSIPPEPNGSETNGHCLKTQIRKKILGQSIADQDKAIAAANVCNKIILTNEWQSAKTVGFYWPRPWEISTIPLINMAKGKRCYLPVVNGVDMAFYRFNSLLELKIARNSIMEPAKNELCIPELLIVPCVAVSISGFRIGYGKGIYDRYLMQNNCKSFVIAYKYQVVEENFVDPWDQCCNRVFYS